MKANKFQINKRLRKIVISGCIVWSVLFCVIFAGDGYCEILFDGGSPDVIRGYYASGMHMLEIDPNSVTGYNIADYAGIGAKLGFSGSNMWSPSGYNSYLAVDDFVLGYASAITAINFWKFGNDDGGGMFEGWTGQVRYFIYSDAGTSSTATTNIISSGVVSASAVGYGSIGPMWWHLRGESLTLDSPIYLPAGHRYWLGLQADTIGTPEFLGSANPLGSFWVTSDRSFGHSLLWSTDYDGWVWHQDDGQNLAFNLEGYRVPVPEPATMLLLGCGLIGLAGLRKRFKKLLVL